MPPLAAHFSPSLGIADTEPLRAPEVNKQNPTPAARLVSKLNTETHQISLGKPWKTSMLYGTIRQKARLVCGFKETADHQ